MTGKLLTWMRERFDRYAAKIGTFVVVGVPCAVAAAVATLQKASLMEPPGCNPLPIEMFRLEVAWSRARFASLLDVAKPCQAVIRSSFVTYDAVFPILYAVALSALFLWAERWRRVHPNGTPKNPCETTRVGNVILIAAALAAVCDTFIENLSLYAAMSKWGHRLDWLLVIVGSAGATIKWLLLLGVVAGTLLEVLSGPRGDILRRTRFSVLAVVLGTVPLLAIPQGEDILRRMFEGDHPALRLLSAMFAPVSAGFVVWYCARKLTELRFRRQRWWRLDAAWFTFYGDQIPRILGTSLIGLIGIAFAQVGIAAPRFFTVAAVTALSAVIISKQQATSVVSHTRVMTTLVVVAAIGMLLFFPYSFPGRNGATLQWWPTTTEETTRSYLRIAAYLCLLGAWMFHVFVHYRRRAFRLPLAPSLHSIANPLDDRGVRRALAIGAMVSITLFALFTWTPVYVGRGFGPIWVLVATVSNAVFMGSIIVWVSQRIRLSIVTAALAVAVLFSLWNDNHVVRLVATDAGIARVDVCDRFLSWRASRPPSPSKKSRPVFLVAAAGGGLRAAYWAAISLAKIEEAAPGFAQQTFAFSGVSGGSLGGALFAALVADNTAHRAKCGAGSKQPYTDCVHAFMRDDFLSPVLAKLVAPDFLQWFLPFPVRRFDRSIGIERSWEASYKAVTSMPTFEAPFLDLTRRSAEIPVMMFNSTHVETGRRYVTTSVVRNSGERAAHRFLDARDLLDEVNPLDDGTVPKAQAVDMRLSTAVHNSARFTYVSPAAHLDSGDGYEHGRVVDGGYFENSGLATLREVVDVVKVQMQEPPWIVYLCNDPKPCVRDTSESAGDVIATGLADEVLSPVRALLNTRDARGGLARASMAAVAGHFLQLNVCDALPMETATTIDPDALHQSSPSKMHKAPDRVVDPPLGWVLSQLARDWMDASLQGLPASRAKNCYEKNATALAKIVKAMN